MNQSNTPKHNSSLTPYAQKLRKCMTKEELHLWYDFLISYPIRFLRQKVIDNYIVDFYCNKARLVIELDGSQHYLRDAIIKDSIRTEIIESRGLLVIRIPNSLIFPGFREVCEYINCVVTDRVGYDPTTADAVPLPLGKGGK